MEPNRALMAVTTETNTQNGRMALVTLLYASVCLEVNGEPLSALELTASIRIMRSLWLGPLILSGPFTIQN